MKFRFIPKICAVDSAKEVPTKSIFPKRPPASVKVDNKFDNAALDSNFYSSDPNTFYI